MIAARAYLEDGRIGAGLAAVNAEVARILAGFDSAALVEPAALLPADVLIDLYGEDLRARAFTTHDPVLGEQMLRPDFTVPVVQMHMAVGNEPARYRYAGQVWRKQEPDSDRPTEYLQVGYELFDGTDIAAADAEVFALISTALKDLPVQPVTGDIGIMLAAIDALETNERRKAALRHHAWRPNRFKRLLARYSEGAAVSADRAALLQAAKSGTLKDVLQQNGPVIGLRSTAEISERIEILLAESEVEPIAREQVARLEQVLAISGKTDAAIKTLQALNADTTALEARANALEKHGINGFDLPFKAGFGRTTLEYYDGFVFGFHAPDHPDLPQIAQGGRYDALTRVLGQGQGIPAVGGIIRPEALLALKGAL
ncbi:MAG: ATP phosphoribosyltransferase regulatory subunit [Rhodobacteraceae bacterium]|nr:ATP phosphoribosyltransferase regulatory subunit [Paracoccaceae bacterium]